MLFNSIDFIIFFTVVITCIALVKYRRFQHLLLLAASYFFYFYTSNYLIVILVATTIMDFLVAKAIWESKNLRSRRTLLACSIAGNLGVLGFFKYADFAVTQFN